MTLIKSPIDRKYTLTHEWVAQEGGVCRVGITHHAQEALGDIVYLQMPAIGAKTKTQQCIAVIESVKAAADIYAPMDGEIVAINEEVVNHPEKINQEPFVAWLFAIKPASAEAIAQLLTAQEYEASLDLD